MATEDWLANQFEAHRKHLLAVALRMLGSASEADDAVQETWLRLSDVDDSAIANLGGWLTTVVSRICLNVLRSRRQHGSPDINSEAVDEAGGPEHAHELEDTVGAALLVVLDTLEPSERLAFVLHDMFGLAFDDIAPIVERTPAAARQLASRARRRIRQADGGSAAEPRGNFERQRVLVEAFIAASRDNDFAALLAVLDPDVVMRADRVAVETAAARKERGAPLLEPEVKGAEAVARVFLGRAGGAQPVMIDGVLGAAWMPGGNLFAAFVITIAEEQIESIEIVVDKARLDELDVSPI